MDEDQDDDDEPQEENGEISAGAFTAFGLGSGIEEEDDGYTSLNKLNAEADMEELVTEEQKQAMSEFAATYAKKIARDSSTNQAKRCLL